MSKIKPKGLRGEVCKVIPHKKVQNELNLAVFWTIAELNDSLFSIVTCTSLWTGFQRYYQVWKIQALLSGD